jgi:hypothetical protein
MEINMINDISVYLPKSKYTKYFTRQPRNVNLKILRRTQFNIQISTWFCK